VDEACASVRVTRETSPEAIDKLERKKLELEVEIHALEVFHVLTLLRCNSH
jgi:ATP-dependent Clp protease ATP-binding subunit ClpB